MNKKPVRIGFVGCGSVMSKYMRLSQELHCKGLVEVVAACDIKESARREMRDHYGVTRITEDYREVLAMPDVDLVLVLTSMQEHYEITKAALLAGKHVLVEKPMGTTLEQAAELVEMAKTTPGLLMPAPHIVLSQTYKDIWNRVQRGDVGRILTARAMYGWAGPWWGQWFYKKGGGSLFDLGVYNVTSLTGILGPAKRVMAMTGITQPDRIVEGEHMVIEAEDNAQVLLDFGNSTFAVITTGFSIQQYRCPAIELYGTKGTIQMMGDDWDPEGYELWLNEVGAWQVYGEPDPAWPWVDGLRHLVECIQNGTKPLNTPEHAYHVLEIMIKAQESGQDGQAKELTSTFSLPDLSEHKAEEMAAHLVHDPSS
ncbi:MAG TPA: Gfo/Idh/MocA family oxidoreductase [Anaerolineales bacterium]|nr:Gfo/Idh/MocA family oxidoreductase [Anaerolineales bacterium]